MELLQMVVVLALVSPTLAKLFTLEAEQFAPNEMRMPRSGASANFTVLFHSADSITLEFCIRQTSTVSVNNIVYSNDGPIDTIAATLNGIHIGAFQTTFDESGGNGWNVFRSSGQLPGKLSLRSGRHYLVIKATTSDQWGVEIDTVLLNVADDIIEYSDLMCNLYCFGDITYEEVPRKDSIPSARFVQKSVSARCSEQDNVKVELYHATATEFEISTNLPKYQSFSNRRDPNYENCVLASPYWLFSNQTVSFRQDSVHTLGASLAFSGSNYRIIFTVTFNFKRLTPTREVDERLIGTILRVRLRNLPNENVKVSPQYVKNGVWVTLKEIEFTPFAVEHFWEIPDRTWEVIRDNQIRLTIEPGKQTNVVVETVRLDRRGTEDTTIEMHSDPDVVFQGVRLGFWHHWDHQHTSMTVKVLNGDNVDFLNVDSIRIYTKVPWNDGYSQVCVIFQDGRTRLQTMTPHGLDYIPFGSSFYIGQPVNVNDDKPYAPIKKITIEPRRLYLIVEYLDGNTATMQLQTTFTSTKLKVKDMVFKKNRYEFPVMTYKSMWINDGNSDVDHVTINGGKARHIMSPWNELYGITAVFFRQCISQHNTQGPDLKVEFLSERE